MEKILRGVLFVWLFNNTLHFPNPNYFTPKISLFFINPCLYRFAIYSSLYLSLLFISIFFSLRPLLLRRCCCCFWVLCHSPVSSLVRQLPTHLASVIFLP